MSNFLRVPYGSTVHGQEEIEAVVNVLKTSTQMSTHVREFEEKIAKLFNKDQIEDIKNILSYLDSNFVHQENKIDFWLIFREYLN